VPLPISVIFLAPKGNVTWPLPVKSNSPDDDKARLKKKPKGIFLFP
jgi:hypothetical protein